MLARVARLNSSSRTLMRCWVASLQKESDVFSELQGSGHCATSGVGNGISSPALFADVLLQLLVGVAFADHCALLEPGQLQRTFSSRCLLEDAVAFDVDRGASHDLLAAAGLSSGIFSFAARCQEKRAALPIRDHSFVGELSGASLCVEDHSRLGRRFEYFVAVRSPDQASAGISLVQSVCRGADADSHLYAVRVFADLCGAGTCSAKPGGGFARFGRNSRTNILEDHSSAFHSGSGGRGNVCFRTQPGRFSCAAVAGWAERDHDFEYCGQPVWRGL